MSVEQGNQSCRKIFQFFGSTAAVFTLFVIGKIWESKLLLANFKYSAPLFSLWNFSEQTKISHLPCSTILVLYISLKPGINSKKRLPWEYTWLFNIWIRGRSYAQVFIMRKIFLISTQTTVSRLTCSTPLVLYAPLKSGSNSKKVVTMIPLLANWKSYQQLSCVWNDFCVQRFMLNIFFP